jgi:hypothetical protein
VTDQRKPYEPPTVADVPGRLCTCGLLILGEGEQESHPWPVCPEWAADHDATPDPSVA